MEVYRLRKSSPWLRALVRAWATDNHRHDEFLSAVSVRIVRIQVFRTFIMDPAVRTKFVHMQMRSHSTVYCTTPSWFEGDDLDRLYEICAPLYELL